MANNQSFGNIIMVGDVLLHTDIITEYFCCDLSACRGKCCIEGDAGAPVTLDEVGEIENALDVVWPKLTAQAQTEIDRNGVSYIDQEGDLVTSIVQGKDCVFTTTSCLDGIGEVTLCALECAHREGKTRWCKPISCALYPIREKKLGTLVGLNYHRWSVCEDAVRLGQKKQIPVYRFLREPLVRRFGEEWYAELETVAQEFLKSQDV